MGTGSSGKSSEPAMIRITYNDIDGSTEYRPASRGKVLVDRGVSLASNRTELIDTQYTLSELAQRAKAAGATVEAFTKKQVKRIDAERAKAEASKPDYQLGVGLSDNRDFRRKARNDRLSTRATRKKRR